MANTSSRHELAEQTNPQIEQRVSQYVPHSFPPFSVPTDTESLSSGFPYTQRLAQLRITRDQWHQFSLEVVNAAKLSFSEDAKAWATGVGTGAASSAFLLVFGPAVGYYTGKAIHKKTVVKKVQEKLAQDGELRSILRHWNEGSFRENGLQVWLEAPTEEIYVHVQPGVSRQDAEKEAKKLARRFKIVVQPYDPRSAPLGQMSRGNGQSPVSPANEYPGQNTVQVGQGQVWGTNQGPLKPYGQVQQSQGGWGHQKPVGYDGKPVGMVQELPGPPMQQSQFKAKQTEMVQELPGGSFIAELDGGNGDFQSPPELPPKVPPKEP